jgi:cell division protein FtsB
MPAWLLSGTALRLLIAVILVLSGMLGGWKLNDWRNAAAREAVLKEALAKLAADQERLTAVSAAYENVAEQLRRLQRVNTREVIRETARVEYRCPVPDTGRLLIDRAIGEANAATGQPDATVRAD